MNGGTSGGGIRVEGCQGAIKVDTSGGGIQVTGGSGSLEGHTSGGGVTVRDFGGPAVVDTSGGGIMIENVNGRVKASTSGGPIEAVLPSPIAGDVALSTSGGGVTVKVPGNAVFDLDAGPGRWSPMRSAGDSAGQDRAWPVERRRQRGRSGGCVAQQRRRHSRQKL